MSEDQRNQYEEAAAKEFPELMTDNWEKERKIFVSGCEYAHNLREEAETEAWNRAIDEVEKWALSMWARNEHSIFTELKKLRK